MNAGDSLRSEERTPARRFHPRSLRIGALLPGSRLPAWQARCIERLNEVDASCIELSSETSGSPSHAAPRRGLVRRSAALRLVDRPKLPEIRHISDASLATAVGDLDLAAVLDLRKPGGDLFIEGLPLGVWRFRFGAGGQALPGIDELVAGTRVTTVDLEAVYADGTTRLLDQAHFGITATHGLDQAVDRYLMGSAHLPALPPTASRTAWR